jgi:fructokinase
MSELYGGIEAGGTKFVCAVGSGSEIVAETRIPTTTPTETLARVIAFFQEQQRVTPLAAIGVGSFGPVDPNPASPTFGSITTTPKPGWAHTDIAGMIRAGLGIPVGFDTDVNVAALGEYRLGAAQNLSSFIYLTIGTGIGGGGMVQDRLIHGLIHPEIGHMRIPHDWQADPYPGSCPYHGDCLEGLACGPAIEGRWGRRAETLPPDHPAWQLEAHYLALALTNLICTLSPQRIIMGGGVMAQVQIWPEMRRQVQELLNDYVQAPQILDHIEGYIVPPGLGTKSGVLGALALAQMAAQRAQE